MLPQIANQNSLDLALIEHASVPRYLGWPLVHTLAQIRHGQACASSVAASITCRTERHVRPVKL